MNGESEQGQGLAQSPAAAAEPAPPEPGAILADSEQHARKLRAEHPDRPVRWTEQNHRGQVIAFVLLPGDDRARPTKVVHR
jgi:hypothetical protein